MKIPAKPTSATQRSPRGLVWPVHPQSGTVVLLAALCVVAPVEGSGAGKAGSHFDPPGDTLGSGAGQPDVTRFSAMRDAAGLHIRVDFSGSDARPEGVIELDMDGDAGSGAPSVVSALCPAESGLGAELRIDLFSFDPATSTVALRDPTSQQLARLDIGVTDAALTISVPPTWLGSTPAHLAAAIGSTTELTDCVPDSGFLVEAGVRPGGGASVQPAIIPTSSPFTLGLLVCMLIGGAMVGSARRR